MRVSRVESGASAVAHPAASLQTQLRSNATKHLKIGTVIAPILPDSEGVHFIFRIN